MTYPANLTPIMAGAEAMDRVWICTLLTGGEVRIDPKDAASLDAAEAAIIEAAVRKGIDGRVMFCAVRRVLGDIVATRAASRRKGTRTKQAARGGSPFTRLVLEGERAFAAGLPRTANPHQGDDRDAWDFGYEGAAE